VTPAETVTSEQMLRAIRRLLQRSAEHSKTIARDSGLTVPQLLCLRAVERLPAEHCTVAHVAGHADLSLPTASRLITRLVDRGYLAREHSPLDRRKVFLVLTELGRAKLDSRVRVMHERFVASFEALHERRRVELISALEQIAAMLDGIDLGQPLRSSTR
jgi:DNA-binding MarR family transcriptional regulator